MTNSEAVTIVTGIYRTHLGRAPDHGGLTFWSNALVNGHVTQANLGATLGSSPEGMQYTRYLEGIVRDIYWSELGRLPDAPGMTYHVDALRNGTSEANISTTIRGSSEAVQYRASLPVIPQPDPRLAAMKQFDTEGNAVVAYRKGDTLLSLAQQAYGTADRWWVIAEANNAMTDYELAASPTTKIPDIRHSSENRYALQFGDDGNAFHFIHTMTGENWLEYHTPIVSQLPPIELEDFLGQFDDILFTNGNDIGKRPLARFARADPHPVVTTAYWDSVKNSPPLSFPVSDLPLAIDRTLLEQLPVFNVPSGMYPPPPPIHAAPGTNPAPIAVSLRKYPEAVLNVVTVKGVRIGTVFNNITEIYPQLRGEKIPGWAGKTWDESPGGFNARLGWIIVATSADAKTHGSESLFDHELGHAFDWAEGYLSQTPLFEAAYFADFAALQKASPTVGYYTAPNQETGTRERAKAEAYAESFGNYYAGKASWFADKPNLLRHFRSTHRPPIKQ